MEQKEIIIGNDEICKMLGWESDKVYVYKVPNLFPSKENSGYTEFSTQAVGFHNDWNMCIGAYNEALRLLEALTPLQKELLEERKNFIVEFGAKNFFHLFQGQLHISSCWYKLVDVSKWLNQIKSIT